MQLLRRFPGVLREPFVKITAIDRVGARADLGVAVGQAHGEVGNGHAGRRAHSGARIAELECPVLVGAYVDLVSVILAGFLEVKPNLDCMVPPNLCQAVGRRIDRAGGMRWVRTARQAVEVAGKSYSRNLPRKVLSIRNQVRIVDAEGGPVEAAGGGVDRNVDVVQADGRARFIDHGWAEYPGPGYRVSLVRPFDEPGSEARSLIERSILVVGESLAPELDTVFVAGQEVGRQCFLPLVDWMRGLGDPVLITAQVTWRRRRIRADDGHSVVAQPAHRDDVVCERCATRCANRGASCGIVDRLRLAIEEIRPQQFAEIALTHKNGWNGLGLRVGEAVSDPLLSYKEKPLVPVPVE